MSDLERELWDLYEAAQQEERANRTAETRSNTAYLAMTSRMNQLLKG
jgi:hypothetical protein